MLHRSLTATYRSADGGRGCIITDKDGKAYLDASGGAAVSCLGHGHPRINAAIKRQVEKLAFAHTSFFTNDPAEELAARLSANAPGGPWRVYFTSGGSEATEAALKLTRQMQVERGEAQRDRYFARLFSYHGNTLGALAVSGNMARRKLYEPILPTNVTHVAACHAYRHQTPGESAADYGLRAARSLADAAAEDNLGIAFIAETVAGATLGAVPPAPGYFREIRRICDAHGLFLILDEVMCGMGRCGTLHAFEREGVVPDIITLAKGLGAGYQPIGAVMVRQSIADELQRGSAAFQHGHTYMAHAIAAAAALEVQKVIAEDGLVARVGTSGALLMEMLAAAFGDHPHVGDIRGRGLLAAFELVSDRKTKSPFPAERRIAARIKALALDRGLLCYPMGGAADGVNGDHVLLAPPYIIGDSELEQAVGILKSVVDEVLKA